MRILVAGAGAIGGYLAGVLARAGHDVTVLGRGAHLAATRERGRIALETTDGKREEFPVAAVADAGDAAPPDVLFITVKAHQVPELAPRLASAAAAAEIIVPCHNGVGWWYFHRHPGRLAGRAVHAVDPDGSIARHLDPAKVVPTFAFKAAEVVAPGVVRHIVTASDSFPVGELDGQPSQRVERLSRAIAQGGIPAPVADVRQRMWWKLLGNIWANPIGALTGTTVGATGTHPATRTLSLALMSEVAAVATALGVTVDTDFERRLGRAKEVPNAKASMLQDRERGRPLEYEAILGAVVEIAELVGVKVPHTTTLYACLALLDSAQARARAIG
jgi:2-dehydropantoate 2-reductase